MSGDSPAAQAVWSPGDLHEPLATKLRPGRKYLAIEPDRIAADPVLLLCAD